MDKQIPKRVHLHTECFVRQPRKSIEDEFSAGNIVDASSNEIPPGYATLVIQKEF